MKAFIILWYADAARSDSRVEIEPGKVSAEERAARIADELAAPGTQVELYEWKVAKPITKATATRAFLAAWSHRIPREAQRVNSFNAKAVGA